MELLKKLKVACIFETLSSTAVFLNKYGYHIYIFFCFPDVIYISRVNEKVL